MKKLIALLCCFYFSSSHAHDPALYLQRFLAYTAWNTALPHPPTEDFIRFISEDKPLSIKLREKWLYTLAQKKDWPQFLHYYKPSSDKNLQCFAYLAQFQTGQSDSALAALKPLWLNGETLPGSCDMLFNIFLSSHPKNEVFLSTRIAIALTKKNLNLVRLLLKKYRNPRPLEEKIASIIQTKPTAIETLPASDLRADFYLYGLKRLISLDMDKAIALWQQPKTRHILSIPQQQSFLSQLALYKAMRHEEDANTWFSQITPAYYTPSLAEWHIRLALKNKQWSEVKRLISQLKPNDLTACWHYWLARADAALGHQNEAMARFQTLAKERSYYGFLASAQLNQPPQFNEEHTHHLTEKLAPYQSITHSLKSLYDKKAFTEASHLLTDFTSELPTDEKGALLQWVANELHWYSKSVYLSNTDGLSNQLSLRFPLAYAQAIEHYAKAFALPPALVYAVIRQESGFRDTVVSPAGARGLMQLMPATAKLVSQQEKLPYKKPDELFISDKNIRLGCAYLHQLIKRYNRIVYIAAAYNAGPRQLNNWRNNLPTTDMDIWIETIPWFETRNYLKNIVSFYMVYQYRLHRRPNLNDIM